jgi:hypothetical protein
MSEIDFAHLNNENDSVTCRGRAAHARMAAQEATDEDFKRIFVRLAELYETKAKKLDRERDERQADLVKSEDSSPTKAAEDPVQVED